MRSFINDPVKFEESIKWNKFLSSEEYYEIQLLTKYSEDDTCFRCGKRLEPLTYINQDFYHLPCWECLEGKKNPEKDSIVENIERNIKDYYSLLIGDRYLQLFLVDDIYFSNTLPHDYEVFKQILLSLNPPSRNDIWFLDFVPGYPKIISPGNLNGLKLVNITKAVDFNIDKDVIRVGEYEIGMPEFSKFEPKRQLRYSILNRNRERKTVKVRVGDKYVKLFNTDNENVKSIFKLTKDGREISFKLLSHQDFVIIKLAIMRNKTFMKLIFDIAHEIYKQCKIYRDCIFLKNTIVLDPRKTETFNLVWFSMSENINNNYINVSII